MVSMKRRTHFSRNTDLKDDLDHAARLARKRALVGDGNDTALASTTMDILLARGRITTDEHMAVAWLASLYRYRVGRIAPVGALSSASPNRDESPAEHERLDMQWWIVTRQIQRCHITILVDIGVFGAMPPWLARSLAANKHSRDYAAFRVALSSLVDAWSRLLDLSNESLRAIRNTYMQRRYTLLP